MGAKLIYDWYYHSRVGEGSGGALNGVALVERVYAEKEGNREKEDKEGEGK